MKNIFIAALASAILFTSCNYVFGKRIHGNGVVKTENRSSNAFSSVEVSGNINVMVKSDSSNTVRIEADENLLEYIEIATEGSTLRIRTRDGYNLSPSTHIKVYVSAPLFDRLSASGACDIFSENKITSTQPLKVDASGSSEIKLEVNAPKLDADLSGSCSLMLVGQTKDFRVHGSGSTDIKSMGLMAENVDVHISGSGDAEVYASVKLNVEVSGSGSVKYKGNASVNQDISGSASVKKVD